MLGGDPVGQQGHPVGHLRADQAG